MNIYILYCQQRDSAQSILGVFSSCEAASLAARDHSRHCLTNVVFLFGNKGNDPESIEFSELEPGYSFAETSFASYAIETHKVQD